MKKLTRIFKTIRFYISPYFIVKYPLLRDIKVVADKTDFSGRALDIGCGVKPYSKIFTHTEYLGIDFKNYSQNNDYVGERPDFFFSDDYLVNFQLPFEDLSFENVFAFQVLEHHKDPNKMFQEIDRILKSKGKLLISVPFLESIHESPHDYQRFTQYGLYALFERYHFNIVDIYSQGRFFSVQYFLAAEALNNFAAQSRYKYIISACIYLLFLLPLQYICLVLDKLLKSDAIVINYLVFAEKS